MFLMKSEISVPLLTLTTTVRRFKKIVKIIEISQISSKRSAIVFWTWKKLVFWNDMRII